MGVTDKTSGGGCPQNVGGGCPSAFEATLVMAWPVLGWAGAGGEADVRRCWARVVARLPTTSHFCASAAAAGEGGVQGCQRSGQGWQTLRGLAGGAAGQLAAAQNHLFRRMRRTIGFEQQLNILWHVFREKLVWRMCAFHLKHSQTTHMPARLHTEFGLTYPTNRLPYLQPESYSKP